MQKIFNKWHRLGTGAEVRRRETEDRSPENWINPDN